MGEGQMEKECFNCFGVNLTQLRQNYHLVAEFVVEKSFMDIVDCQFKKIKKERMR